MREVKFDHALPFSAEVTYERSHTFTHTDTSPDRLVRYQVQLYFFCMKKTFWGEHNDTYFASDTRKLEMATKAGDGVQLETKLCRGVAMSQPSRCVIY